MMKLSGLPMLLLGVLPWASQAQQQLLPYHQLTDSADVYHRQQLEIAERKQGLQAQLQDANEKVSLLINAREAIQGPEQSRKKKNKKNPEEEQLALEKAEKFHDDFVVPALREVEDLNARLRVLDEESIAKHEKEVSFLRRSTALLKYAGSHPGTLEKLRY